MPRGGGARELSDRSRPERPAVSIVIPAFNAERTIEATLQSVLAQTDPDFEAVVIDDGSTDATAERVSAFADGRIRLVRQPNGGLSAARNAGIEATRGRYVSFLDADDLWLPTYIAEMRGSLDGRCDAGFAYTDAWVWHDTVARFGRRTLIAPVKPPEKPPEDPRDLFRSLLARNYVYVSATVRRDVLAEVGSFDHYTSPSEDWELWLRIAAAGYRAVKAPVLAIYRIRPGSLSSEPDVMRESATRTLETVATYDLDSELRGVVRERLASFTSAPAHQSAGRGLTSKLLRRLPASLRLDDYRLRPPHGVSPALHRLLLESS